MGDWLWPAGVAALIALLWWLGRPPGPDTVDRFKQWRL
jgi:hypothetical protein